jgi:hypothetical protein
MAGDYTRFRYNPVHNTTAVQMAQGRVLLDQDWNEYVQLQDRRWRAETMDIIGRAVVPIDTPNAFELTIAGTSFTIGIGRMYVDGLVAENHGVDPTDPTKRIYDPILGELAGISPVPYEQQPYYPNPPAFPADGNPHLVYLDVWEREVTYLEDPNLIDPAVAVDTATLLQTVWQVKVLVDTPAGTTCATPPGSIPAWVAASAPSAGRLTTAAAGVPSSTDPCIVPPNGGYRGSGNRCYRVEIHNGGPLGTAQFKWSRDNAAFATAVTAINAALDTLTVVLTRRDSVLRFQPNDWVEVTDDFRYFHGLPGEMRQVASVNDVNLTITLKTPLPAGEFDATQPDRHTRVIRWDQHGIVRDTVGNQIVDVDTNGGLIPVPAAGTTLVLEDGIQITFSIDSAMPLPNFNPLDYWMFAARVINASVEILNQAPPRGILHHYAWLGFVTLPGGPATSCRVFWPPEFGEGCDCAVCVTADSHNNNTFTIQSAISQVEGLGGGKVCLGPGVYNILSTITIAGSAVVEISGHGLPKLVAATGFAASSPIFLIDSTLDTIVEDIAFVGPAAGPNQGAIPGIVISNTFLTRIQRCVFISVPPRGQAGPRSTLSPAIGINGFAMEAQIHENFFSNVVVGVGSVLNSLLGKPVSAAFLTDCSIRNNEMICIQAALAFIDPKNVPSFSGIVFADNSVTSAMGFQFNGSGLGVSIERNSFVVNADPTGLPTQAIVCGASELQIVHNRISGEIKTPGQNGIVLAGITIAGVQVTGNQISGLAGTGILVMQGTRLTGTIVSQNQMSNLGGAGIAAPTGSFAVDLNIAGNVISTVGLTAPAANAFQSGILLQATVFNLNIADNVIENVAPGPQVNLRSGILVTLAEGLRIAGNRIVNVGPITPITLGGGILVLAVAGRADVIDNEVRRAVTPPLNGDASPWGALLIVNVAGDANIRGNLLESFGTGPTTLVVLAKTCLFSDNQCYLDNPNTAALPVLAVRIGESETITAGMIIASNNFVQTPIPQTGGIVPVMNLNPANPKKISVLGNIVSGEITVGASVLAAPWAPLNVNSI